MSSAIVRCVILITAQVTAGVVALDAYRVITGAEGEWPRWEHIVSSLAGYAVLAPLMLLMIRLGRDDVAVALKLRAAPLWAYPATIFLAVVDGPWKALIVELASGGADLPGIGLRLPQDLVGVVAMMVMCTLAPLMEESLFRGYLLYLLEKRSVIVAIALSSVMFSIVHLQPTSPWSWIAHLPFAVALAISASRFRSLYPPIVAHAAYNLLVSVGLSPARWLEPTAFALALSALLYVLGTAAVLRRSPSSARR